MSTETNQRVADRLREAADLLQQQGGNPFRAGAYRRAGEIISRLEVELAEILRTGGMEGLTSLPGVGRGIASAIVEMLRTGRWAQLERLRGTLDPVQVFTAVPGLGRRLAQTIHDELHIDSLEALEAAAWDGRLERVPGMGPRRTAAVRGALEVMLGRLPRRRDKGEGGAEPPVSLILEIDREYREKAAAGKLPLLAPRRFNPEGKPVLPILHTEKGLWHFTALYSNTARAHELGKTRDWVVVYFYTDHQEEGQRTVVTETRGPRRGERVVRGREGEGGLGGG